MFCIFANKNSVVRHMEHGEFLISVSAPCSPVLYHGGLTKPALPDLIEAEPKQIEEVSWGVWKSGQSFHCCEPRTASVAEYTPYCKSLKLLKAQTRVLLGAGVGSIFSQENMV